MDYNGGPGMVPGFHIFWLAGVFVVFVVGAVLLVIWAIRSSAHPQPIGPPLAPMQPMPPQAARETPLEILARRFASGEITAEEYERGRDLLGGGP